MWHIVYVVSAIMPLYLCSSCPTPICIEKCCEENKHFDEKFRCIEADNSSHLWTIGDLNGLFNTTPIEEDVSLQNTFFKCVKHKQD